MDFSCTLKVLLSNSSQYFTNKQYIIRTWKYISTFATHSIEIIEVSGQMIMGMLCSLKFMVELSVLSNIK